MRDFLDYLFRKDNSINRFFKFLYYELKPTIIFTLIVSIAVWIPFDYKNNLHESIDQAIIFFLYLFLFHGVLFMIIGIGLALFLTVCSYYTSWRIDRKSVGFYVLGANTGFLLALNCILRFVPSYKLLSVNPFITPLGLVNLLVFIGAIFVILYFLLDVLTNNATGLVRQGKSKKGFIVIGTWFVIFVLTCIYNFVSEVPKRMDVEKIQVLKTATKGNNLYSGKKPTKVLLLGLDGMSWYVLEAMLKQGQLPNLGTLIKNGTRANLKTIEPTISPVIWTSIATGRTPEEHGIYGFWQFSLPGMKSFIGRGPNLNSMNWWNGINRFLNIARNKKYSHFKQHAFLNQQRRVAALWDIADHYDIPVGVVGWLGTWPVTQLKRGSYMVRDFSGRKGKGSMFPEEEIHAVLENVNPPKPALDGDSPVLKKSWLKLEMLGFHNDVYSSIRLLKHFHPVLSLNYYHSVDAVHHRYWLVDHQSLFQIPSEDWFHHFSPHITDSYLLVDQWVGDFISAIDPETLVIVVSDHGYNFNGYEHHNAPDGVLIAAGPGIRPNYILENASVYDIMPTILSVLGLPIAEDIQGRVLSEMFLPNTLPDQKVVVSYDWFKRDESNVEESPEYERDMIKYFKALGYVN